MKERLGTTREGIKKSRTERNPEQLTSAYVARHALYLAEIRMDKREFNPFLVEWHLNRSVGALQDAQADGTILDDEGRRLKQRQGKLRQELHEKVRRENII